MRRKFAALLLSAVMVCSVLAGCSGAGSNPASSKPSTSKPSNNTSTTTPSGGNNNNNNNSNNGNTKPGNSDNSGSTLPAVVPKVVYNSTYSYQENSYYQVYSTFTITNPNTINDFTWGTVVVTYKDANGKTIGTCHGTFPPIAAGDTVTFSTWTTLTAKPADCSYTYDFPVSGVLVHSNTTVAKQSDLLVSDAARNETYCAKYTCKVKNNSSISMKHVIVHLYYVKDGKMYSAGHPNYIYDLAPGETQSCEIPISYSHEMKDYDSFVLIANQWY